MIKIDGVSVIDNSEIEEHCKCERRHYFRHERRWIHEGKEDALSFGDSWHKGMDAVWAAICWDGASSREAIEAGCDGFMARYTELGYPDPSTFASWSKEEQAALNPRSPMVGLEMMYSYVETREKWLRSLELLAVEEPFLVPIDPDDPTRMYAGKIDKAIRLNGRVIGIDHKTTTWYAKDGYFRNEFLEGFNPNRQLDGYLHALRMKYGRDAKAVWADCALVHKSVHDGFRLIPVENQQEHMEAWLWETNLRITNILADQERLATYRAAEGVHPPVLTAFPRRPESCTLYGKKCAYIDLCRSRSNPETWEEVPPGYKEEHWSPFTPEQIARMESEEG
jgi:hypothetical protein